MRFIVLLLTSILYLHAADAALTLAKDGSVTLTAQDADLILYGHGAGLGMGGGLVAGGQKPKDVKVDPTKCQPFYGFEIFDGKEWKSQPMGFCGTGAGAYTLKKGTSATFKVGMHMFKQRPIRLAINYKLDAKGESKKALSNELK